MEFIYLLTIIGLFFWLRNTLNAGLKKLSSEIIALRYELQEKTRRETVADSKAEPSAPPVPDIVTEPPPPVVQEEPWEEYKVEAEPIRIFEEVEKSVTEREKQQEPAPIFSRTDFPPPSPKPTFFELHPDLEKFIGENLINKIGIAILVLGIAYFVKFAIDKEWINEIGRVAIGVLAGGLLIGIAHRLRKTFKAFSSVLIGGGLAVLYFTIAIAFHQYHIFSQAAAFIVMAVITGFAVALSIAYDRIELAVLALIGGFTTPFIVSTGEGNYKILFTYLLILNIGMLVLAYRKKWNLVNLLCYLFTVALYGAWLITKCLGMPDAPYMGALLFGTAFYLVFFLMNIIYNIQNRIHFKAFEIGILLSNTALYYAAGMAILFYYRNNTYQGLFTVLMGVFNLGFAIVLFKRQNTDRNLIYLLIGLVLTFISLAAPVQLEGNHITLFWAAESVLLLWFSQKSGIKLVRATSVIVCGLMTVSLAMDWMELYAVGTHDLITHDLNSGQVMTLFLNKAFLTAIASVASVLITRKLLDKEEDAFFAFKIISLSAYKIILGILFVVLLYLSFSLELNYQLSYRYEATYFRSIGIGIYNFIFLAIAWLLCRKQMTRPLSIVFTLASGFCLFCYFIQYNSAIISSRADFLQGVNSGLFFKLHYLLALLFITGLYIFNQSAKLWTDKGNTDWIKWTTAILVVYIASAELSHLGTWISYSPGRIISYINRQVVKTGYTVLWGLISFVLMQQGMKRKDRVLRIVSLSLFFLTILKLFLWDIRGISEAGKIIAFISLGVILLVVSFMYQRLKRLILENDTGGEPVKNETPG